MACLGALEELQWPLDRIVTADVLATDTIPADLPPMVEFKEYADKIIKERYGIDVEHYKASTCYEKVFYRTLKNGKRSGQIMAFPMRKGNWCNNELKMAGIRLARKSFPLGSIEYIGIAADEPNRFHNLTKTKLSPLIEIGWTEADCRAWCKENGLLSPIYMQTARGGCWFCHNQRLEQLRQLKKQYPDLWALLLKWDADSPVSFHADGHTVHDFDKRFEAEEKGIVPNDRTFRWSMLNGQTNSN